MYLETMLLTKSIEGIGFPLPPMTRVFTAAAEGTADVRGAAPPSIARTGELMAASASVTVAALAASACA